MTSVWVTLTLLVFCSAPACFGKPGELKITPKDVGEIVFTRDGSSQAVNQVTKTHTHISPDTEEEVLVKLHAALENISDPEPTKCPEEPEEGEARNLRKLSIGGLDLRALDKHTMDKLVYILQHKDKIGIPTSVADAPHDVIAVFENLVSLLIPKDLASALNPMVFFKNLITFLKSLFRCIFNGSCLTSPTALIGYIFNEYSKNIFSCIAHHECLQNIADSIALIVNPGEKPPSLDPSGTNFLGNMIQHKKNLLACALNLKCLGSLPGLLNQILHFEASVTPSSTSEKYIFNSLCES